MSPEKTVFESKALDIIQKADNRGIVLRVMGAVAFRIHCHNSIDLIKAMNRPITDLDFMGYGKQRSEVINLFKDLGYILDREMLLLADRLKLRSPSEDLNIDVFMDELEMSHTVEFKGRLELDYPTIPLADLLLEKMEIVRINEKDLKDTILLLREHRIGKDKECIDPEYIAKTLADDWGFYYTLTTNLKKTLEYVSNYDLLNNAEVADVRSKISKLMEAIESAPKSLRWKMRAKVGKLKWYEDLDEAPF